MTQLSFTSGYADDSGDKVSGTIFDKAFFDSIQSAINNLIHSTTNPTVTPADIIDEVVEARGNEASLDARISGVIDDDGNFTAGVNQPDLLSQVLAQNMIWNGDMEDWSVPGTPSGGASGTTPTGFGGSGTSAVFAKAGSGQADTTTLGVGSLCSKVTRNGTDCYLSHTFMGIISSVSPFADLTRARGQKVSFIALVKASVASQARLKIDDSTGTSVSSYHVGDGTVQLLSVTHTISPTATGIPTPTVELEVNNSDGDVYTSGWRVVFSDVAPADWSPEPVFYASNSSQGIVSLSDQNMGLGVKRFSNVPRFYLGTVDDESGSDAYAVGFLGTDNTNVVASSASDVDVHSRTLAADSFSGDGEVLEVEFFMTTAANGNTKRFSFDFDGTVLIAFAIAYNAMNLLVKVKVIATGATTARIIASTHSDGSSEKVTTATVTGIDWTSSITYKGILPTHTTNNDTDVLVSTVRAYSN